MIDHISIFQLATSTIIVAIILIARVSSLYFTRLQSIVDLLPGGSIHLIDASQYLSLRLFLCCKLSSNFFQYWYSYLFASPDRGSSSGFASTIVNTAATEPPLTAVLARMLKGLCSPTVNFTLFNLFCPNIVIKAGEIPVQGLFISSSFMP